MRSRLARESYRELTLSTQTRSLDIDGFWLVTAAAGYLAQYWYDLPPFLIVIGGALAGLLHYAVVR